MACFDTICCVYGGYSPLQMQLWPFEVDYPLVPASQTPHGSSVDHTVPLEIVFRRRKCVIASFCMKILSVDFCYCFVVCSCFTWNENVF